MRQLFITSLLLASFFGSSAQNQSISEQGCGTVTTPQEMQALAQFLASDVKAKTTAGNDSIPLSIHIVGKDNGTGYYKLDNLFSVICELNTKYAPVGFYFYIKWPIQYINNTSYYIHDFWSGSQMMYDNNVGSTVNVYFVDDPAGACGYFSPQNDGIAIKKSCSNPGSTTLVHELGHYFGLPHTFYGWEHGATPANPEKVTRGAGANCSYTGDLFCDTDADYISDRWYCPYVGTKTDVTGTKYHPDSSLYMSYSMDNCQSRFSNLQMAAMQNNLHNQRSYLLTGSVPFYNALAIPGIVYPNDSIYANNTNVKWHKVAGADYYQVKISLATNNLVKQEGLTSDTTLGINFPMYSTVQYKVTVTPLSSKNLCRDKSLVHTYHYSLSTPALDVTSLEETQRAIGLYPNPASSSATIDLASVAQGTYAVQILNLNGQKVYEQAIKHIGGSQKVTVPLQHLSNGIYMVKVTGNNNNWTEKLVIQK
jgi:hypothetical protein